MVENDNRLKKIEANENEQQFPAWRREVKSLAKDKEKCVQNQNVKD